MSELPLHRLVRASAGTGKTYRLTLRFLEILFAGGTPERVLATTFTRKAAAEILDRLLLRLSEITLDPGQARRTSAELAALGAADAEIDNGRALELLRRVCARLPRLQVATLDAFFFRASSLFRLELGLPRLRLVTSTADPRLAGLRQAALQSALRRLSAGHLELLVELLARLHRGDAQRSVLRALDQVVVELYELYRSHRDPALWRTLSASGPLLGEQALAAAIDRLADVAAGAPAELIEPVSRDVERALCADWLHLLESGPAARVAQDPARPVYRRRPLPDRLVAVYRPVVAHAGQVLVQRVAAQTEATFELLEAFDRAFRAALRTAGIALYCELVEGLGRLLSPDGDRGDRAEPLTDLFFRLDGAVHHLLLDELQDTSVEQWRALAPLIDELLAYADGSRTVFCVGDVKQSIYAWRGGCPALFEQLAARLAEGAGVVETLTASYRTSSSVLQAVNRVFGDLGANPALATESARRAAAGFAHGFEPQVSAFPDRAGWFRLDTTDRWEGLFEDDPGPAVEDPEEAEVGDEADDIDEPGRTEGNAGSFAETRASRGRSGAGDHLDRVAREVAELADRWRAPDGSGEGSIGVLTATNATARALLVRLYEHGVRASGEGDGGLDDDPAVSALLAALRLADHPGATAAAFELAAGPLRALLAGRSWRHPEGASRNLRIELDRLGPAATLARWARTIDGPCDRHNVGRLQQLLEQVSTVAADGPPYGELARRLAALPVSEPVATGVRVMTVHRAKGLEFDAVVLCELERPLGRLNNPLLEVARSSPGGPTLAVFRSTNATVRALSPALQEARRQEEEQRAADDLGVVYVAMTRARYELHAFVQPRVGGVTDRTHAGLLVHGLGASASWPEPGRRLAEGGARLGGTEIAAVLRDRLTTPAVDPEVDRRRAVSTRNVETPTMPAWRRPMLRPSRLAATSEAVSVADLLDLSEASVRRQGSLAHRLLAGLEWLEDEDAGSPSSWVDHQGLGEPGSAPVWQKAAASVLARQLRHPVVRGVFRRPEDAEGDRRWRLWRERAFVVNLRGQVVRGIFDRVVVWSRAQAPESAALYEFKSRRSAEPSHRRQAQLYREALSVLLRIPPTSIRARLVYLAEGAVVDV